MGLILVMSVLLTACSTSSEDEEEEEDEASASAQTITMRLVTERRVCNSDAELAEYLEEECGGDKESAKYLEMVEVKKVYDSVEAAFTKVTKANYKVNVDLMFYTEDEYFDMLKSTMELYAEEQKNAELASRLLDKFMSDYRSLFPDITLSDEGLKKVFYEMFPEYEKYKGFGEEEETGEVEDQYQQNKDTGLKEIVYPATEENQLDIIYISGMNMYNEYIENEWITPLDEQIKTIGKKLNDYISGSLLNGVKVSGYTYAIPNNVQIGEYTYMLIDKEVFDATKSETTKFEIESVLDLKYFLEDVVGEYPERLPVDASFKECMDQFVWYWNIETNEDYEYVINRDNEFSALGALYGDPASATRGQIALGFNNLFANATYRDIYAGLKEYEFNDYLATDGETRTNPVVTFVKGDYSMKSNPIALPAGHDESEESHVYLYTDENGKEYYAYVVKYPEVDEQSLYGNMFGVSANSKHLQACIKVLTGLNTDAKLRNILQYGVEGVNYEIDEETGMLVRLDHIVKNDDDTETNYGILYEMKIEKTGNCFIAHPEEGLPANYWYNSKQQNKEALVDPLLGFDFNLELEEYGTSLDDGMLENLSNYSAYILDMLDECVDFDELNETIKGFEKNMPLYKSEDGDFPFDTVFSKLMDTSYDTGANPEKPDLNGESPYTIYYSWMSSFGYLPK